MPTLNWHKREEAVRAATRSPYRLLEPVVELSYGDADILSEFDWQARLLNQSSLSAGAGSLQESGLFGSQLCQVGALD